MKTTANKNVPASLRRKTEFLLKRKPPKIYARFSKAEMIQLVHELEMHLVESEIRIEELLLAASEPTLLQTEVQAAREYAENIVETVREPLVVLSFDLKILNANHSFYETFKVTSGDTIGNFIYDLGNGQWNIPKLRILLEEILPRKTVFNDYEIEHNFLDIGRKVMLLNAREITRNKIGSHIILLAIEDITERRIIEDALQQSQYRFKKLFVEAPLGIALVDSLTGHIYEVNPMFAKIAGRTVEEMTNIDWMSITHPDDVQEDLDKMALLNAGKINGFRMDKRYLHPGGTAVWISMTIAPIQVEDTTHPRHLCMIEDITERRQAKIEIQQLNGVLEERVASRTVQLEAANKDLEAFSYSVSHDLRAPLRGIDGWSHALLEDYGDQLNTEAQSYIHRVRSEIQRMSQLIDDLLNLSRWTRAEVHREQVDLSAIAETIVAALQESEPARDVEFSIQQGLLAFGDAHLLEVVLGNLLGNAFKFTSKILFTRIEFGQTVSAGKRAFFVRDNGAGFDMAYASKLFCAFQRMHKTSEFSGTGIGLVIAQRIIHRHGGQIWGDAHVNQGASFFFTLEENK